MAENSTNTKSTGENRKVRWDDLHLTLSFSWKHNGARYLSLFVPDHFMHCYVNLYAYLEGDMSWEQFIRSLPVIPQSNEDIMN